MNLKHLDAHISFRIEEVREALIRRRFWRCLLKYAGSATALVLMGAVIPRLFPHQDGFRAFLALAFWFLQALIFWRLLIKPLRKPVTYKQAALYIDQHFPELENRITAMVALTEKPRLSWMEQDFLTEARNMVSRSRFGEHWNFTPKPERMALTTVLLVVSLLALVRFPSTWLPWLDGDWSLGGPFTVEPGDARVRIGDDVIILVKSEQRDKAVSLRWKEASSGKWQETPMKTGDSESVHFQRFTEIKGDVAYQVIFGAWKSDRYKITAWLPPEVNAIDLTYHYPDYLDMPPREVPNSGLITALAGVEVDMRVRVNKPLRSAQVVFESGSTLDLEDKGGLVWNTRFEITRDDVYHVALVDKNGEASIYNPTYDVSMRRDEPPTVQMLFPSSDMEVSALDEVPFHFKVSDDYGLKSFGLRFEIPEREPLVISLQGEGAPGPGAEGVYQLSLEEFELEPGDLITWTAWAHDRKPDREVYEQMGPPFFMEIRPYRREFREAVSNNGGMGQQGESIDLVTRQKNTLIGIWNLRKKLGDIDKKIFEEEHEVLLTAQKEILEGADKAMARSKDERAGQLLDTLNRAVDALQEASWPEPAPALSNASVIGQEAYRLLLKLEPPQNRVGRANANASGAQSGRQPDEMGDLEMDRNRNFYEDEKRTGEEEKAALDALDKLDDLARRQQMINDEIAKLISEKKEEQTAEQRRRLERLQEELRNNIEKLDEMQRDLSRMNPQDAQQAQNQLDKAREQMNKGLEQLQQNELQQARSAGAGAVNEMERLEETLKEKTGGGVKERVDDLQNELAELNRMQEDIQQRVASLKDEKDLPGLRADDPKDAHKKELLQKKKELAERMEDLLEDASQVADQTRSTQELLSRKMGDWLRETSKQGILEDMEEADRMARYGLWSDLTEEEKALKDKLAEAARSFQAVSESMVSSDQEAREKAYDQLEQLLNRPEAQARSQEAMEQFVEKDYREWLDGLTNASSWLGSTGEPQRELENSRRQIERLRRQYRTSGQAPEGAIFQEAVVKPLMRTADQLRREIEAFRKERQFVLRDDGAVPDQYRKTVSEYFQQLSESEGRQ